MTVLTAILSVSYHNNAPTLRPKTRMPILLSTKREISRHKFLSPSLQLTRLNARYIFSAVSKIQPRSPPRHPSAARSHKRALSILSADAHEWVPESAAATYDTAANPPAAEALYWRGSPGYGYRSGRERQRGGARPAVRE